jgi:general secretion pathway protein D
MYLRTTILLALGAAMAGCSAPSGVLDLSSPLGITAETQSSSPQGSESEDQRRIQSLTELRKRYRGTNDSAGLEELRLAEASAASHFLTSGSALAHQQRYDEAVQKFDLGLLAQPGSAELLQARQTALGKKDMARLYAEGTRAKSVGNYDLAETMLQKAAFLDGENANVKRELADLDHAKKSEEQHYVLTAFHSPSPVAVNFRDAKLKDALKSLCDPYNLNFVFDKNADNFDVSVSAKNVNLEQAFNMILQSSNTTYKVLGPNSVFIYENTPEKRKQFADRYFKTFHLSTLKAERMAEILKASMDIKTLFANNDLGTIQVRDTRETLDVVEKLVAANDRKPAEIMLNLEVLEIDRTKLENLGIDIGSQIAFQPPAVTLQGVHGPDFWNQGALLLPTVTLNYLKSNTDARTLSNPRIRTVDGQPAKIHVGDRVPLQAASIQDATGQSRTMFEYHDIGIRLDVLPKYHLDDSIFVDLNIEVSSLGQNLSPPGQPPAYAIGTRNVHTTMILREGETAALGGLIKEEEQKGLGGFFSSAGAGSAGRTELLLTITPYLVRSQSLPRRGNTDFYSGTDDNYSTKASYDYLNRPSRTDQPPKYNLNASNKNNAPQSDVPEKVVRGWQPANFAH